MNKLAKIEPMARSPCPQADTQRIESGLSPPHNVFRYTSGTEPPRNGKARIRSPA